jgi:tRNA threonylcarbamoyl adenosine modification protein YeaZ
MTDRELVVLVVDTATEAVTAGLARIGRSGADSADSADATAEFVRVEVLAEQVTESPRAHAELLVPAIQRCLGVAGLAVADIDAVVAGVGPGPFTGLRVGLMTAAAFADGRAIPAYPVCSLDAIASGYRDIAQLLVATDARRKEVYWARYAFGVRASEPAVATPAAVAQQLRAIVAQQLQATVADAEQLAELRMIGPGAVRYRDELGLELLTGDLHPSVHGLARGAAAQVLDRVEPAPLTPLYLRRPDAVEPSGVKSVTR